MKSPLGTVYLVTDETHLYSLDFSGFEDRMHGLLKQRVGPYELMSRTRPSAAHQALTAYFDGELGAFNGVLRSLKGTEFQMLVWKELGNIAPGTTRSYQWVARRLGKPRAARAVGSANGRNPIALAIPCHRVIGASGALGGYAGGVDKKSWLLSHERKWA